MTHSRIRHRLAIFAAVLLATPLFADSQARIVRLSNVHGNVQIDRRTGDGFESAIENLPVTEGARISTKDDGRVEIEFEDGSTVRFAPNTSAEFTRLSLRDSGAKNTELDLTEGTGYFNIDLGKRDDFVVNLGHRSINLERSARFRASADQSQARVAVSHGEVEVLGAGSETLTVSKHRTISFDLFNQDQYSVARSYEESPYDDWDNELDQYHERNFNQARSDSSYSYGFSDLNYYGSYNSYAGYGNLWRPYFADIGWSPFNDGSWVWYPGFGYTWVSAYPWGWAPYRYGNWVFLPGGGWFWQPGGGNRWSPVPRVVNAPVGFRTPVAPPSGHGPVVIVHGNPIDPRGPASRFGDPTRRVVREGSDGGILPYVAPKAEAGLGVPRGRTNLSKLPSPPTPNAGPDFHPAPHSTAESDRGNVSRPTSGPAPRMTPPAPMPRMAPPASAPRTAPPAPTPRGAGRGL